MRLFNVRRSCLVLDNNLTLYLMLDHATIFIRLRATMQNLRYGRRIRSALLDEKIVLGMSGLNEYFGRVTLFR